jgi:hypothetical protein
VGRLVAIGAVLVALSSGCNQQFADLTAPYIGMWQINPGEDTADCGAGPGAPTPMTGAVYVNSGAAPLILSVSDSNHGDCIWTLAVSTVSATLRSGPECAVTSNGSNAVVVPIDYVMTLSSTPNEATVTSTFDWTILAVTCRHVEQQTLVQ